MTKVYTIPNKFNEVIKHEKMSFGYEEHVGFFNKSISIKKFEVFINYIKKLSKQNQRFENKIDISLRYGVFPEDFPISFTFIDFPDLLNKINSFEPFEIYISFNSRLFQNPRIPEHQFHIILNSEKSYIEIRFPKPERFDLSESKFPGWFLGEIQFQFELIFYKNWKGTLFYTELEIQPIIMQQFFNSQGDQAIGANSQITKNSIVNHVQGDQINGNVGTIMKGVKESQIATDSAQISTDKSETIFEGIISFSKQHPIPAILIFLAFLFFLYYVPVEKLQLIRF
jgi:hypothetical protein